MDSLRVAVQAGTGYELLLSALVVADQSSRSRLELGATIQARAREIDPSVRDALRDVGREPFINLLGWVHAMVEPPSAEGVVAALAAADPAELKLAILGYYRRAFRMVTPPAVIREASAGDRKAITELRGSSYPYLRHWQRTLRYVLATDATALRARLAEALRTWRDVVFADLEPTLRATDEADVATTSERVATHPLDQVLEAIVPGLTFAREVGQSMVVLVPSVVVRPSFALADYGSTLVIAYPAAAPAVARDDGKRLATLADALGDELRVQVLGELRGGPVSTSELARRLGVPRTSLQHHLTVLLNAGLAAMAVDDARTGAVELRRDRLLELARLAERVASVEDATGESIPSGDEAAQT